MMKNIVIAAAGLALAGVAHAQAPETPQQDPAAEVETISPQEMPTDNPDSSPDPSAADADENGAGGLAQWGTATTEALLDETPEGSTSAPATGAMDGTADPAADPMADPAGDPLTAPATDPLAAPGAPPIVAPDGGMDPQADAAPEAAPVVAPDVGAPEISETNPGVTGAWLTNRRIWTTNDSAAPTDATGLTERPENWQDIAKVQDIVLDDQEQVVGYLADIGGFLGIGVKQVLLGTDALELVSINDDWFFVTGFTKAELEALPDFDAASVRR